MKKDIEWLKEELLKDLMRFNGNPNMTDYELGIASGISTAINLTEKLDEKDKPVIPEWLHKIFSCERDAIQRKYVDPWIVEEVAKTRLHVDNDLKPKPALFKDEKQCEYVAGNYETIINAIFNGYEVEKEKKYYVAFEDINLLYVTRIEVYGENGKLNYNSESSTENAMKFIEKEKASSLAYFLGAIVVEVAE